MAKGGPYGNKYAVGNNGGRPPMYETPEEIRDQAEEYFEWIKGEKETKTGMRKNEETGKMEAYEYEDWKRFPEPPTVTGLTLFLGFASLESLSDYEKKSPEFSYIIKRARKMVENGYEMKLHGTANTGAIFALKNMGWRDKTEHEINANVASLDTPIKFE